MWREGLTSSMAVFIIFSLSGMFACCYVMKVNQIILVNFVASFPLPHNVCIYLFVYFYSHKFNYLISEKKYLKSVIAYMDYG